MENEIINVSGGEMLEAINRSEIDGQIATAHKFPRDIMQCKQNMVALAAMDDDVAYNCFYHLERKGKDGQVSVIEGPSVRFTEIIFCLLEEPAHRWPHHRQRWQDHHGTRRLP